ETLPEQGQIFAYRAEAEILEHLLPANLSYPRRESNSGRFRTDHKIVAEPPMREFPCPGLVVFLPVFGIDPVVEVLLKASVDADLIEEQVHPDQQIRLVIARGKGERLLRKQIRHNGESAGRIGRGLPL